MRVVTSLHYNHLIVSYVLFMMYLEIASNRVFCKLIHLSLKKLQVCSRWYKGVNNYFSNFWDDNVFRFYWSLCLYSYIYAHAQASSLLDRNMTLLGEFQAYSLKVKHLFFLLIVCVGDYPTRLWRSSHESWSDYTKDP